MKQKINFEYIKKRLETSSFLVFTNMISEVSTILETFKLKENSEIRYSLANYVIIRLVSAIESFLKSTVRELIDEKGFSTDRLFERDEITISLADLDEIKDNKITKGRIVAHETKFQNLNQIDGMLSRLLSLNGFLNEVKKHRHIFKFKDAPDALGYSFNVGKLNELFNLRHRIVHEMYETPESEYEKLWDYFAQAIMFTIITTNIIDDILPNVKNLKND